MSDYLIWATENFISMCYGPEFLKEMGPELFGMFMELISDNKITIPDCLSLKAYAEVIS